MVHGSFSKCIPNQGQNETKLSIFLALVSMIRKVNALHAWRFSMRLLSSARKFCIIFCRLQIFVKLNFLNTSFMNNIRVSNGLDPDEDRHSVGPDLCSNCLQRLSADDTST